MAIAHVGSSTSNSGTGTSATVTYSPVAGNLLIATTIVGNGTSRTVGSGWTALTEGGTATAFLRQFWKIAGAGESSENPETWTGSVGWACVIDEFSGVASVSPVDVENCALNASASPLTTPIVAPTAGVERIASCGVRAGAAATWTSDQVNASASGVSSRSTVAGLHTFDLIVPSTSGTYQGRSTPNATSANETAAIAMFKGLDLPELLGRPFGLRGQQQMHQLLSQ